MQLLSYTPIEVDTLARMLEMEPRTLNALLVELEMSGAITRHGGNRVARMA